MTDAIDLTIEQRKTLNDLLRRFLPGVAVWAYGSRVKWTARPNSDLDLVAFTTPAQRAQVADLKDALAESNLPFLVDLHVWDEVPERFREIIQKDYVVVQEAKEPTPTQGVGGEWRARVLGELTDNFDGMRVPVKEADRRPGPYPYYGASGVVDHVDRHLFEGEYLLIAEDGENLRTRNTPVAFLARGKFWVNNHAHIVRGNNDADTRFLMYALSSNDISGYLTGSTMPKLTQGNMNRIPISVPPLSEQRAIAHILGTLDDKIELNRQMSETLEAMARALFKSWFVDFDPVRAKAAGRDPGLPKHIADLFPDSFEDSALGEIPRGWELGRLDAVAGFLGGYAFKSKDWIEQGVPVVKIGSVKPGIVDLSAVSHVSNEVAEEAKRFRLTPGDLLIGMTGYVGEVGLVPPTDNPPLLNQRVGKFVLEKPGTAALAYLYCLTRQPEFKAQVETKSHGTAQANVSAEGILSIQIVVPPKTLRDQFNRITQPFIDRILENHGESVGLATQRDTLLPKLISGDLRIEHPEQVVNAVPGQVTGK